MNCHSIFTGRKSNESGQSLVEYTLLLLFAIGLILGLSAKYFKPMNTWANYYFGTYLQCLLDTGELPSLGGDNSETGCNAEKLKALQVAGLAGNGSAAGLTNGDPSKKSDTNKNKNDGPAGAGANSSSGSNYGKRFGSVPGRGSAGVDGAGSEDEKKKKTTLDSKSAAGSRFLKVTPIATVSSGNQKVSRLMLNDPISRKIRDQDKKKDKVQKVADAEENQSGGIKKFKIKKRESNLKTADSDEKMDFSVGNVLRWAFIIMIILLIIIVVGGQLLQLSKRGSE
jgi:hypothetical protein